MKILLDQSAPRNLVRALPQHEVTHAAQLGWEEIVNGASLKPAVDHGYDLLITADQNRPFQQNSAAYRLIGILALSTNNGNVIKPHLAAMAQAVEEVKAARSGICSAASSCPASFQRSPGP